MTAREIRAMPRRLKKAMKSMKPAAQPVPAWLLRRLAKGDTPRAALRELQSIAKREVHHD